ncbi:MAG: hypothetical protein WC292_04205 [Clostridia bacterium]
MSTAVSSMDKKEVIRELYKNAQMGVDSIEVIKNYVEDRPLINILNNQKRDYQTISDELEQEGAKENIDLRTSPLKNKAKVWGEIVISTIKDKSPSKIAEIMMQGVNMGIIGLSRIENRYEGERDPYIDKLQNLYKANLEAFRPFL